MNDIPIMIREIDELIKNNPKAVKIGIDIGRAEKIYFPIKRT